jgi:hypothetical protein
LKALKDAEKISAHVVINNLCFKVIDLRHKLEERKSYLTLWLKILLKIELNFGRPMRKKIGKSQN